MSGHIKLRFVTKTAVCSTA